MNGAPAAEARTTPEEAAADAARRPRAARPGLALFLLFAGLYLLTASGHFYAVDEETMFRVTESLVERRSFKLPEGAWGMVVARPPGDPAYAQYAPAQSILAVPFYLLGRLVAYAFPPDARGYTIRFCAGLLTPLVTAATVAILYRVARALGYREGPAIALAAIYGLGTLAWPYSRTFFAEPLAAFFLLGAFYAILRGTEGRGSPGWIVASGASALAAVATKPQAAIVLPILGAYLLWRAYAHRTGDEWRPWPRVMWRVGLAWGAGLLLVAVPFMAFNALAYSSPLRTGYGATTRAEFSTPFLTGLYGLTISSGKGLLWYAPPILLALGGWWAFFRQRRAEALVCLAVLVAHLAFYSPLRYWHGDGSWGPRYLVIALPFGILPAVTLLDRLRERRALLAPVALVVALGVLVQLLGILVNFDWHILRSQERERHFSPPEAPLLAHARTLGRRAGEWRMQLLPPPDTAILADGFSYAEPGGGTGALFPRWTTGSGRIALRSTGREDVLVKLTFFDHRPPEQRRERPEVSIDGRPLAEVGGEGALERRDFTGDDEGWIYQFTVPAATLRDGRADVTLQSPTWNPKLSGQRERDEDLGVFVHNVEVWRAGQPWDVREGLAIGPLPRTPRWQFWWYNDDSLRHHLADHWAWYATVAGFPRPLAATRPSRRRCSARGSGCCGERCLLARRYARSGGAGDGESGAGRRGLGGVKRRRPGVCSERAAEGSSCHWSDDV